MKNKILLLQITLLIAIATQGQELRFKYKASRILMDSTLNKPAEPVVKGIIEFYKPEMDRIMQEVVGKSKVEMLLRGLRVYFQILLRMLFWNLERNIARQK